MYRFFNFWKFLWEVWDGVCGIGFVCYCIRLEYFLVGYLCGVCWVGGELVRNGLCFICWFLVFCVIGIGSNVIVVRCCCGCW